jgi:hypothetical protein
MWILLLAAVGVPVMALAFFALLEGALSQHTPWEVLSDTGTDLCNLSIGIVGGMFLSTQLQTRIGQVAAPVVAISVVMLNLILAAMVMLVNKRFAAMPLDRKAYLSIFLGLIAVAVPSGMIIWFGAT